MFLVPAQFQIVPISVNKQTSTGSSASHHSAEAWTRSLVLTSRGQASLLFMGIVLSICAAAVDVLNVLMARQDLTNHLPLFTLYQPGLVK